MEIALIIYAIGYILALLLLIHPDCQRSIRNALLYTESNRVAMVLALYSWIIVLWWRKWIIKEIKHQISKWNN